MTSGAGATCAGCDKTIEDCGHYCAPCRRWWCISCWKEWSAGPMRVPSGEVSRCKTCASDSHPWFPASAPSQAQKGGGGG